MNTVKYRAFVETVRYGSLTLAAEALNYTQSGVSHMIGALEKEYGFPLLFRSKSGVTPTENGKRVFDFCVRIVDTEDALNNTVCQINGVMIGKLRIGSFLSVLIRWMPSVVQRFSEQYPDIELQLFEGEISEQLEMLENGRIDVGLFSPPAPEGYAFDPISRDEVVVILPRGHELARKKRVSRQDLLQYQSSLIIQHESANEDLRLLLGEEFTPVQNRYSVRSDSTIIALVAKGLGIAVAPRLLVGQETPELVIRSLETPCYRTLGLVIPEYKTSLPVIKCFRDVVRSLYGTEDAAQEPS